MEEEKTADDEQISHGAYHGSVLPSTFFCIAFHVSALHYKSKTFNVFMMEKPERDFDILLNR